MDSMSTKTGSTEFGHETLEELESTQTHQDADGSYMNEDVTIPRFLRTPGSTECGQLDFSWQDGTDILEHEQDSSLLPVQCNRDLQSQTSTAGGSQVTVNSLS